ncbi:MAG: replication-associated recombination protein A [Gammaproteobacteria bacterium]|nr:replication-associated recombination protein A [Gammaproteobacteria bacterium]
MTTATTDRAYQPLAARMRPQTLEQFIGQMHLTADGKPLWAAINKSALHSMILWGPPGSGKTTLAKLIANHSQARFESISAVLAGVKDIRAVVARAKEALSAESAQPTILFTDEVHRFNKSQQDAFLPHVEDGTLIFIGATTENPSFALNNALLSRTRVYILKALQHDELKQLLDQALSDNRNGLGNQQLSLTAEAEQLLIASADGDGRQLLNLVEIAADFAEQGIITTDHLQQVIGQSWRRFDRHGDYFYDQISALHKSIRGSAPDAALYWLARMIDGGCDPLYIARRLLRMASEDIGNADPRALQITLNAWEAQQRLGSPEGELALAQAVLYLACAAKSNAVYSAFKNALEDARRSGSLPVPPHLCNAPTQLMKASGYSKGYRYPHDEANGYAAGENYLPEKLSQRRYYYPSNRGLEIKISEKLATLRELDKNC